jgi:excisionase family DNA binding protein
MTKKIKQMRRADEAPIDSAPLALSVKAFCKKANIGHDKFYDEVRKGRLRARKLGARTLIPLSEAERWLDSLPILETGKREH